jgi:RHS repeat-associated protein
MATPQTFAVIRLDTSGTSTEFPRNFKVQVANDNVSWATAPNVATGTSTTAVTTIPFAPQSARFIRVTLTAADPAFWSIHDFNVYSTTLPRTGWVVTASVNNGSAGMAIDSTAGTRWSTATTGNNTQVNGQWLQVDMGSPQTFNQITLDTGSTTATQFPRGFMVTTSNDGTTFGPSIANGAGTGRFSNINFPTQLARFVRITLSLSNPSTVATPWAVEELNVQGQQTGATTQTRVGWTATATSNNSNAGLALDGSTGTSWTSTGGQTNQTFTVDMGTLRTFTQVTVDAGATVTPRTYQLQIGNSATGPWTTVTSVSGTAATVTINVQPQTSRFIRINQTATSATNWSIRELTVSGPAVSRAGWIASASSNSTGNVPGNAIDGSASTRWSTAGAQTNQTFTVDMGTAHVFNQLTLDAGTTPNNFPRNHSVFVSNDGTNWGTAVASGTGNGQLVTINFLTQTARFFQIRTPATPADGNTWSIQELGVWRITQPCDATCVASDQCHAAGTCNPSTGICSNPNANDGTTCNDGNGCTQTDTCQAGACVGGNPKVCTALDQCHTAGTCAPATGLCSNPAKPDGTTCNDGAQCTQSETCLAGTCQDTNDYPTVVNLPVLDLGSLGLIQSFANDINSSGTVVGWSSTDDWRNNAWVFSGNGPLVNLAAQLGLGAPSAGRAINDANVIVGFRTEADGSHTFRYGHAGLEDFGLIGDGSYVGNGERVFHAGDYVRGAFPTDINDADEFAGFYTSGGTFRGYRFTNGAGMEDVGALIAGGSTFMEGIGESGTAVGSSTANDPSIGTHAVLFDNEIAGLIDLNSLIDPLGGWILASANGINGDFIVGAGLRGGVLRPFRLHRSTGVIDDLSHGWLFSVARSVNAAGDVVGFGYVNTENLSVATSTPFVYTDQLGFKTLEDLIPPDFTWTFRDAASINASGEIVGWGYHAGTGGPRPFRLDLSPQAVACDQGPNVCGAPTGSPVCVWADGVVELPDGRFVALFGYQNSGAVGVSPTINEVRIDGTLNPNPQPTPPTWLAPGTHTAAYRPIITGGQMISWTVDGQVARASASLRRLPRVAIGAHGYGVMIDGTLVTLQPDVGPPPPPVAQVEPPPGPRFLGTLTGRLDVGPSGAATYTVPISIPPGIAGMAPNLSLVYNSQGGNGIAGQGWELAGLSMIHRCSKTRIQDGHARPIHMNVMEDALPPSEQDRDGICIDGKRLFERESGSYETEAKDFSKITRSFNYQVFTVLTKTGETRYYGRHQQARVELPSEEGDPPTQQVAIWALDRVVDAWGNYFDVIYNDAQRDFLTNGLRVTRINYTGNLATATPGCSPNDEGCPFSYVEFEYEPRPDVRHIRFRGWRIPRNSRLTRITTPIGKYILGYLDDDVMLPSRLASINYCGGQACPNVAPTTVEERRAQNFLEPLVFDWEGGNYHWEQEPGAWIDGQENTYALPTRIDRYMDDDQWRTRGTQFVDLNGDGRLDFVVAKGDQQDVAGDRPDLRGQAWENNGHGWTQRNEWALPAHLARAEGEPTGTLLVDIDGDGLLDLASTGPECTTTMDPNPPFLPIRECSTSPFRVWLNRINQGQGWVRSTPHETIPPDWGSEGWGGAFPIDLMAKRFVGLMAKHQMGDLDGDGRADLAQLALGAGNRLPVLINSPTGWIAPTQLYGPYPQNFKYHLEDINRDGLADLVYSNPEDVGTEFDVGINTGISHPSPGKAWDGTVWDGTKFDVFPGGLDLKPGSRVLGDIDGDGFYDPVMLYPTRTPSASTIPFTFDVTAHQGVAFATGLGYGSVGTLGYRQALLTFGPETASVVPAGQIDVVEAKYRFTMADVNGDGLADLILRHPDGGQLLINTGTTWKDIHGATTRQTSAGPDPIPFVPSEREDNVSLGAAFVDLDGDGLDDLVKAGGDGTETWMNRFRKPVIRKFPNGLARKSEVTYAVTTTEEGRPNYRHEVPPPEGTTYLNIPLNVVTSVAAEDGRAVGALATTRYFYESLRGSASGRGPQGFHSIRVETPSGKEPLIEPPQDIVIATTTTFAQAYPYTGMPTEVRRYKVGPMGSRVDLALTETTYCDSEFDPPNANPVCTPHAGPPPGQPYPARTSLFIHAVTVKDTTPLLAENGEKWSVFTFTNFRYDDLGNPHQTAVDSARFKGTAPNLVLDERHETITDNEYGLFHSREARFGKVTRTTVTARRLAPSDGNNEPSVHTTLFQYETVNTVPGLEEPTLGLRKKMVEFGAGVPIEHHTVYDYDVFGNVVMTKSCASEFNSCTKDGTNTAPLTEHNPPFRTTTASYDPSVFAPTGGAIGSLNYGKGRFPVRTVNAAGHVEYSAYEPSKGVLLQQTSVNGVHTCFTYDVFGRQETQIDRCGVSNLTTTTEYRLAGAGDPEKARVVIIKRPPTGGATWVYTDALGHTVGTMARAFDGGFVKTLTDYDELGRVRQTSKPFAAATGPTFWTFTEYDTFARVGRVTESLGVIDETANYKVATITTHYDGPTIHTDRNVGAKTQRRSETKNILGKVSKVVTRNEVNEVPYEIPITYKYDADGNLKSTHDPVGNSVQITYDVRGRRTVSTDPDMGTWFYQYNGFGDLIRQSHNNGETTMKYDVLGRVISRNDGAGEAQWVYDAESGGVGQLAAMVSAPEGGLNLPCDIPHTTVSGGNRTGRSFKYTPFGELRQTTECTDGDEFVTDHRYDTFGREDLVTYPEIRNSRLSVAYKYTSLGYLHFLSDPSGSAVYWAATAVNSQGQVTAEYTGNDVETTYVRNEATGWLMGSFSRARADGLKTIQNWAYRYDEGGNLRSRVRGDEVSGAASEEFFQYDPLNRLTSSRVKVLFENNYDVTEPYAYNDIGNLTAKGSDSYTYGNCGAGPHAVCTAGSRSFQYDGNGNMTEGGGNSVTYNVANKPTRITGASGATIDFSYGADGHRVVQAVAPGGTTPASRTVYVGLGATGRSLYERTTRQNGTEHVQFLYAGSSHGGSAFALRVITDDGTTEPTVAMRYYHRDHLGSVTAMSDEVGKVRDAAWGADAGVMGYDPWGARRSPNGLPAASSFKQQVGRREFTGHETIPDVGLVNMNGRVYDPALGRFLAPDPNIQFIADLQSYNRYSYVLNNPLSHTDPTGYFISPGAFQTIANFAWTAGGIAACTGTGGGCVAFFAISAAAFNTNIMVAQGASFEQVLAVNAVGFASGQLGGVIGGAVASHIGDKIAASLISGAISGAVSSAVSTAAFGGDIGENVLTGALQGAFWAAVSLAAQRTTPVSQASQAQAQGDAGSGAGRTERRATAGAHAQEGDTVGEYDEAEYQALMAAIRAENVHPILAQAAEDGLANAVLMEGGKRIAQRVAASPLGRQVPVLAGRFGESFVRTLTGFKLHTDQIMVGLRLRAPDILNYAARRIGEIKNVRYQALTSQLRDYLQISMQKKLVYDLYVRVGEGTKLSAPLEAAERLGWIKIHRVIPYP